MKNVPHSKKLVWGIIAACALVCAAAALRFLAEPAAAPPAPDSPHSLYRNAVKPAPADPPPLEQSPLLEDPHTYVCGALLYQSPALSSYFPDGGSLGSITRQGELLNVTDDAGNSQAFSLAETQTYRPEEFQREFAPAFMAGEFEAFSALFPAGMEHITRFTYQSAGTSEPQSLHLWETVSAGSGSRLWMGDVSLRLYALIDLYEALPFFANGALWTYDPQASTAVPVRFELDGPVTVTAGRLSSSMTEEPSQVLTVGPGETVYWWPAGDSTIRDGTALEYCWDSLSSGAEEWSEKLEFRSVMLYEGLYGSKTYGISNNWLGLASSAIHPSALHVDGETGELVIGLCENDPYATGMHGAHCIRGRHTPPEDTDAASAHHHNSVYGEEHGWKNCS